MKIVLNEMKKIFSFKKICLLIVVSALIYNMFMSFDFEYFPNGRPDTDEYRIMSQFVKENGNTMGAEQFKKFESLYKNKIKQADEFIKNNDDFKAAGVHSYEEMQKIEERMCEDSADTKIVNLYNKYMFNSSEGTIFWELQALESDMGLYKDRNVGSFVGDKSTKLRMKEISDNKENNSILPAMIMHNYERVITYLGVCVVICTALMLLPIFIRDKKDKVDCIQYSSKHGRKIFRSKIEAGILSSLIITTILTIMDFVMYSRNHVSMFFDSNINSTFNSCYWFSLTFIQYIIISVVLMYILSLVTAIITMFISSKVSTFVAGVGITVPMLFAVTWLISMVLFDSLFSMGKPKYLVLIIYLVLVVMSLMMIILSHRKEKTRDVLN